MIWNLIFYTSLFAFVVAQMNRHEYLYRYRTFNSEKPRESIVSSFQKDWRYCKKIIWQEIWFDPLWRYDSSWLARFSFPMRITGFRLSSYENFTVSQPFKKEMGTLFVITYTIDQDWQYEKDVYGNQKIYKTQEVEFLPEYEEYGFVPIDPEIIATNICIYVKSYRGTKAHKTRFVELFGCADDYAIRNFQYNSYEDGLLIYQPLLNESLYGCTLFDFEDGKLMNWTIVGNAFENQPTFGDVKFVRGTLKYPTGFSGKWWISSDENYPYFGANQNVGKLTDVGLLKSPPFVIDVPLVSFLIGGEYKTGKVGVEIRRYNLVVASFYLSSSNPYMVEKTLKIESNLLGSFFVLHLVDDSVDGYLMFDCFKLIKDSCSCDCCEKLGMQKNTDSKYYIPSESITSNCNINNPDLSNSPENARFSSSYDDKVFKCLKSLNYGDQKPWLSIKLTYISVIDGWTTQGFYGAYNCSVSSYYVRYAQIEEHWRYMRDNPKSDKILYRLGPNDKEKRQKLNPRIEAQYIKFIFKSLGKETDQFYCFRVEIYGCSKYSFDSVGQPIFMKNVKISMIDNEVNLNSYLLKIIDVPDTLKSISLSCLNESETIYEIVTQYEWWEVIYSSKFSLFNPFNKVDVRLEDNFYKRTFQCYVFISNSKEHILMREFLIINVLTRPSIVPFVTMDPGFEYRGGKLVSGSPSIFYTDSERQAFISVHLADLAHPLLVYPETVKYCPLKTAFHHPFQDLEEYWGAVDFRIQQESLDGFDQAIQDGHRSFYYDGNRFFAGKGTNRWAAYNNMPSSVDCVVIAEEIAHQFGARCETSCSSPDYIEKTHLLQFGHKKDFFQLSRISLWKLIDLRVELNGVLKFSKRFYVDYYEDSMHVLRAKSNFYEKDSFNSPISISKKDNLYRGLEYTNCEEYKVTENPEDIPDCAMLFTPYGSKPWGSGHFLTFLYMFPISKLNFYPRVKVYGDAVSYNNEKSYFEQIFDIRHISKPTITLESEIGVCEGDYLELVPSIKINEVSFNGWNLFVYSWSWIKEETMEEEEKAIPIGDEKNVKDMLYTRREKLIFMQAGMSHTKTYEFQVDAPTGRSSKRTRIRVYKDYPRITWVTPSPHEVVEDISDIIEIRTNTDNLIREIKWFYMGVEIVNSMNYIFLDYKNMEYQRKRLLLTNLNHNKMSGTYSVLLVGDFCSFKSTIDVVVYEKPTISVSKRSILAQQGSMLEVRANIAEGYPPLQLENIFWTKNGSKILNIDDRLSWTVTRSSKTLLQSTLTISDSKKSDSSNYRIEVVCGYTVFKVDVMIIVNGTDVETTNKIDLKSSGKNNCNLHSIKLALLVTFFRFIY